MVQKGEGSSSNQARYAREIFQATATPVQKACLANDPKGVLNNIMSALHDIGVIVGHFKDAYDGGEFGVDLARVNIATSKKVVLERNYFYEQVLGYKKKCEIVETEVSSLKSQFASLEKLKEVDGLNIKAYKEELRIAREEKKAKDAEIAEKDAAIAAKDAKIAQLIQEKMTGPEHVSNFLGSRSFRLSTSYACVHLLRYSIYEQLNDLGKSFLFTSEHLGYAHVPEEEAGIMSLAGYSWDPKRDMLLDSECNPMIAERLELATEESQELPHVWLDHSEWPEDIPCPPEDEEDEEVEGEKGEENQEEDGNVQEQEDPEENPDVAPSAGAGSSDIPRTS